MKLHYENVCSLRNEDVEFKPGQLVCIKGETNQGKSAMFYALVDGLTNSSDFKKHLNNQALADNAKAIEKIDIYDDEGNFWQVEAGTGHFHYRANKVKYEKTGRKSIFELTENQIPGFLYDPDNLYPIMNILDENAGMFPIDRSDAQIFKTYERLLSLSCTQDILRTIKLDCEDLDYKSTDLLKSVQHNKSSLAKISTVFEQIDASALDNKIQQLEALLASYSNVSAIIEKNKRIAEYSSKVLSVDTVATNVFDLEKFKTLLNLLMKSQHDIKYIELANLYSSSTSAFDTTQFDRLSKAYTQADLLSKDLTILTEQIRLDDKKLQTVEQELATIEVCPFCGKPMGDNHDETIHSC